MGHFQMGQISHTEKVRAALIIEFALLFVCLPAALALHPLRWWPLPLLWTVAFYCHLVLRRQTDSHARKFWRLSDIPPSVRPVLMLFLPSAFALAAAIHFLMPQIFLNLPRQRPILWGLVMLLYPLLSVIPQTLIYRVFLFSRYGRLLCSRWTLIAASGAAFSWLHVVLRNPVAPLLTFPAGLLFAWRYARTNSAMASAFEHALYGCLVFTVGLGGFFYTGASR
jgi:uncharacterized protein